MKLKLKFPKIKIVKTKKGLFKPPRHKWIARIVSFKNPRSARQSAARLVKILEKGQRRVGKRWVKVTRKTALAIARALRYAANRAKAAAKRKSLSRKEKKELKSISKIYGKAARKAFKIYHKKYKE